MRTLRLFIFLLLCVCVWAGVPTSPVEAAPTSSSGCFVQHNTRFTRDSDGLTIRLHSDPNYDYILCTISGTAPAGGSFQGQFTITLPDNVKAIRTYPSARVIPASLTIQGIGFSYFRSHVAPVSGTEVIPEAAQHPGRSFRFTALFTISPQGRLPGPSQSHVADLVYSVEKNPTSTAPPPSLPGAFSVSGNPTCSAAQSVNNLSWSASSTASYYRVYRDGIFRATTTGRTYSDTSPVAGARHTYVVHAVNGVGIRTSSTPVDTRTCTTLPGSFSVSTSTGCDLAPPTISGPYNTYRWTVSSGAEGYRWYRDGVLLGQSSAAASFRIGTDTNPSAGTTYTYRIEAFNSAGTRDATSSIETATCGAEPPGDGDDDDPSPPPSVVNPVSYLWRVADPRFGSFQATTSNPASFVTGLDCDLVGRSTIITVEATKQISGQTVTKSASRQLQIGGPCQQSSVIGDIFGRGTVEQLTVDPTSVVSGNRIRNIEGTELTIPSYSPRNRLSWATTQDEALSQNGSLQRLLSERGRSLPLNGAREYHIQSQFNLNPPPGQDPRIATAIDRSNPEGSVWIVNGDLRIRSNGGTVTFRGRGTIVVTGRVVLDGVAGGQMRYNDSEGTASLGIISLGTDNGGAAIDFEQFRSIIGAYFAPRGTIEFRGQSRDATGLFVADQLRLNADPTDPTASLSIIYDGRITDTPPPGFSQSVIPALSEVSP